VRQIVIYLRNSIIPEEEADYLTRTQVSDRYRLVTGQCTVEVKSDAICCGDSVTDRQNSRVRFVIL